MAAFTFQPVMRPREVKIGLAVMVKQPKFPAIRVMTGFARRPKAAKMRVIGQMAGYTVQPDFGKIIADMARFTPHQKVLPDQRKLRQIMVKRHIIAPPFSAVTSFTFSAKGSIMRVIILVAAHTGGGRLMLKNIGRVAAIAARLLVLSGQRKISILLMIKPNPAPLRAKMAAFTARAKTVLMGVLNPVAANTCARQIYIDLPCMAVGARHGGVAILQWKARLRMVKISDLHPVGSGMAIGTFTAQGLIMWLVFQMAIHTL